MLSADQTIVYTSHDLQECAALCDSVLLLKRGSLCFNGPFDSFFELYVRLFVKQMDDSLMFALQSEFNVPATDTAT
jgi:ABC-type uncharacterized transport system ATPase subunit